MAAPNSKEKVRFLRTTQLSPPKATPEHKDNTDLLGIDIYPDSSLRDYYWALSFSYNYLIRIYLPYIYSFILSFLASYNYFNFLYQLSLLS